MFYLTGPQFPLEIRRITTTLSKCGKSFLRSNNKRIKMLLLEAALMYCCFSGSTELIYCFFLTVGVNVKYMKFTNVMPVMEVTYSGSNGINTMKLDLLRERN